MQVNVYHAKKTDKDVVYELAGSITIPKGFADTVEEALEIALAMSQNFEVEWMRGKRETTVGDILEIANMRYLVLPCNFRRIR